MNSQQFNTVASESSLHLRNPIAAPCPECEIRFPLQMLIVELLGKNQSLRMELQELRGQLEQESHGFFGQELE